MDLHFSTPANRKEFGIYVIENVITHHAYIGMTTTSFLDRWSQHRCELRAGRHGNAHLQNAWKVYGSMSFAFGVIERFVSHEGVFEAENFYLAAFQDAGVSLYNQNFGEANSTKQRPSTDAKVRMSTAKRGTKATAETKARQRAAHLGKPAPWNRRPHTSEEIEKIRASVKARGAPVWAHEASAHTWPGFVSPDGTIYRDVVNLARFCREHALNEDCLWRVARGQRRQHQGWSLLKGQSDD